MWVGWFFAGQLSNPTQPDNALNFTAWLQTKGLGDIAEDTIFTACCTVQLYGPLNAITALNGLSWVRPSLLLTATREGTAHIPAGFQNMWRRLAALLGYPVHFGSVVDEVRPVRDGDVTTVEILCSGATEAARFDHAFIACPLDETRADGTATLRHPLTDLFRERHAPFDSTEVYSGVWCASHWPLEAASRCYLPAATSGERGRLLTIRQCGKIGDEWVGQICSYTGADAPTDPDARLRANRAQMVKDMETIVGLRNIRIVDDRLWRYNVRYSAGQLREGLPAVITERQGVEHVWYAGGGHSHWDVDMIANFSQSLAWRFAKRAGLSFFVRLRIVRLRDLIRDL